MHQLIIVTDESAVLGRSPLVGCNDPSGRLFNQLMTGLVVKSAREVDGHESDNTIALHDATALHLCQLNKMIIIVEDAVSVRLGNEGEHAIGLLMYVGWVHLAVGTHILHIAPTLEGNERQSTYQISYDELVSPSKGKA